MAREYSDAQKCSSRTDGHCRGPACVLQPAIQFRVPMDGGHVNATGMYCLSNARDGCGLICPAQIGFSIGGIARRFLVSPPSMIWPANLVTCALFNTLHSQNYAGVGTRGGISRERFFSIAFVGSFCWYFMPGYLFQGTLSTMLIPEIMTWRTYNHLLSTWILQLGLLACPESCGCQPAFRILHRPRNVTHHF